MKDACPAAPELTEGLRPASVDAPGERWLPYLLYEGTFWAGMATATLGFSLRTEGTRHVPRRGPALLIANHQSFLDPALVGLAARRHLCFLARKTLFRRPAIAWLLRTLNAVPFDREGVGVQGLRAVLQALQAGRAVVVFPEGTRSPDGTLQALRPGIQLLIERAPSTIVPVGIAGAFQAWPRWRPLPVPAPLFLPARQGTLAVAVGRPLDAARFMGLPRDRLLADLSAALGQVCHRAERLRRKPA